MVNYYIRHYYLNTTNIFTLIFQSLSETYIRRSLFSSSASCHDRDATWQEIGRICGSACSCPCPGSRIVIPVFECVLLLIHVVLLSSSLSWIDEAVHIRRGTPILEPGRGQLYTESHVRPISCHVASLLSQEPEEESTSFSEQASSDEGL